MPYKVARRRARPRRRRGGAKGQAGKKIMAWLKKANNWLKKSKALSKLASAYGTTGMPYSQQVGLASPVLSQMGYGRRRRGGALRPAGGALGPAGGMYYR